MQKKEKKMQTNLKRPGTHLRVLYCLIYLINKLIVNEKKNLTCTDLDLLERTQGLILPLYLYFQWPKSLQIRGLMLEQVVVKDLCCLIVIPQTTEAGKERDWLGRAECCCWNERINSGKQNQSSSPYFCGLQTAEPILNPVS